MLPDHIVARNYATLVLPTFTISTENAELVTGTNYRWCRDFSDRHGVPIYRVGKKFLIDGPKFFEALKSFDGKPGDEPARENVSPEDATAAVLRELGLVVKS